MKTGNDNVRKEEISLIFTCVIRSSEKCSNVPLHVIGLNVGHLPGRCSCNYPDISLIQLPFLCPCLKEMIEVCTTEDIR